MEQYDIVVIGGGAAGLNVAQLLAKDGYAVCLLDAKADLLNVTFHTLGSFIDLDRFGLSRYVVTADIAECVFHSKRIHAKKQLRAYILDKTQLHKELLDKANAHGVDIKTSTRIKDVCMDVGGGVLRQLLRRMAKRIVRKFILMPPARRAY